MTTIYDALAERLGRKPTHEETKAEVRRILRTASFEAWRNAPMRSEESKMAWLRRQVRS